MSNGTCIVAECASDAINGRGWCHAHYYRWRRYGDPLASRRRVISPEEQIRSHYDVVGECWIWRNAPGSHGYGMISIGPSVALAHRFAYEVAVGPIPQGLQIDHLCFERRCIRPSHLEAVTPAENTARKRDVVAARTATTCKNGHRWDTEAAYRADNGRRFCKACRREQYARRAARHPARAFSLTRQVPFHARPSEVREW